MTAVSPFEADTAEDFVIEVTPAAHARIVELRDAEPEGDRLGVRLAIVGDTGPEFTYDLSFQVVTKSDLTDVIRNHDGLKVIIPLEDVPNLRGAVLDDEDGLVLRNPNKPKPVVLADLVRESELAAEVEALLDRDINPALAAHGGYVTFVGHDDENAVYLTMGGGCHGCAMSKMTMIQGVQRSIVEALPQVTKVVDITDHTTGANPYYT